MSIKFYYGSGSPYAWRVWLALEHKKLSYEMNQLSFSNDDLMKPEFLALNPRHKVPVIINNGFVLYESAAIVEYLEDLSPHAGQPLFAEDVEARAIARRLIREADQYMANALEMMAVEIFFKAQDQWQLETIEAGRSGFVAELDYFERTLPQEEFLVGAVGAADFTVYPLIALARRIDIKKPDLNIGSAIGPKVSAWMKRVEELPYFETTIPPHWKG